MQKAAAESLAASSLRLPCGLVLKNRLVKTAMSEKMATTGTAPSPAHERLYGKWAQGGWSVLITGNIMVDDRYLGGPGDVAVPSSGFRSPAVTKKWLAWTKVAAGHNCHMIAQLNHPGRQSPLGAGNRSFLTKTIAPSAVPLNIGDNWVANLTRALLFGTPRAMTRDDIDDVIDRFASAAKMASETGFKGVEVHAAHGFLLSQFLSPSSNRRDDEFGGTAEQRAEIVLRVLRAVRAEVPASFCVGVKINTADVSDPQAMRDLLQQIDLIAREKIDYLHLSGGSFEDPKMFSPTGGTTRDAFFLECSRKVRSAFPDLALILTGGFRSKTAVDTALDTGACTAVGLGRPAVKYPDLPERLLLQKQDVFETEAAPSLGWIATKIRSVGAGAESKYWAEKMRNI